MIEINPARWKTVPRKHQLRGVLELIQKPAFALFDDPRTGKSKQIVDAASTLFEAGKLDTVVVVAPASCRGVWLDPDLGQIHEHAWLGSEVIEYHAKSRLVWSDTNGSPGLRWIVTNYEFIRPIKKNERRLTGLLELLSDSKQIMLVFDESSALNERRSGQSQAALKLRERAARCVLMNGTPVSDTPLDLWSQFEVLDSHILGRPCVRCEKIAGKDREPHKCPRCSPRYDNFFHFRYSHAKLGGWHNKQILGWRDLEKVQKLAKPYCVRNTIEDCVDLPRKIPAIYEVPLGEKTWKRYKQLREEALLMLPDRESVLEPNAGVRIMRLAQLTSGHVSITPVVVDEVSQTELFVEPEIEYLSDEKLEWTFEYLMKQSRATASIVWCRFRPERERLARNLRDAGIATYEIYGGQPPAQRDEAKAAFHSTTASSRERRVLVAQPHAGGVGLDLAAATEEVYQSNDHSLKARLQSEERPRHERQVAPLAVIDVLATGPAGQRTIDHLILKALRKKEDLATWTCAAWRRALKEE